MNDFRNRPNDNYIFDASFQDLFLLAEHWQKDLMFYKEDLKFLNHLINKYFIWISKKEDIEIIKTIGKSIIETSTLSTSLLQRVNKHIVILAGLIINPTRYDAITFRTEHKQLEDDITQFITKFRNNRKEVFEVKKHANENDELF